MEVTFSESFFKSLKKLNRQNTWWYKTYDIIRYGIPEFLRNVYRFRKQLWNHRWWDYHFTLQMFKRSLEIQEKGMREKGIEESAALQKKLYKMKRAIQIMERVMDPTEGYITLAEKQLGKKSSWSDEGWTFFSEKSDEQRDDDKAILELAHQLEDAEWKELWEIMKGPNYKEIKDFQKEYDGSDLRAWWD